MKLLPLLITILLPFVTTAQSNTGDLEGIVMFQAANGRMYPDAGAQVIIYFIDSAQVVADKSSIHHREDSIVNNAILASVYYDEFANTPIGKAQRDMTRKLKALNAYPEDKLKELQSVALAIIKGRERKQCTRAAADGKGSYGIKLPPGHYGILFRSAHLHSHTALERNGNIMMDDVVIKAGEIANRNGHML